MTTAEDLRNNVNGVADAVREIAAEARGYTSIFENTQPKTLRAALLARTSDILASLFVLVVLAMLFGTYLSVTWQAHERCVDALKEPAVADAVRMALCK